MTQPNICGECNQPFESDRDLQEHQESAHPKRDDPLPDSERGYGDAQPKHERVA